MRVFPICFLIFKASPAYAIQQGASQESATAHIDDEKNANPPPSNNRMLQEDSEADIRSILRDLYGATGGPNWVQATNWNTEAPLDQWYGVTTSSSARDGNDGSGMVFPQYQISLRDNNLVGTIPVSLYSFSSLTSLQLDFNTGLSGSIDGRIGQLTDLTSLDLAFCSFSGPLPDEIGALTKLSSLLLANQFSFPGSSLSGPLPPGLGRLTNLEELTLSHHAFSASLPPSVSNLSKLQRLDLSFNLFEGTMEPLFLLQSLTFLDMWSNQFSGSLTSDIGNLSELALLFLSENQFSGTLPSALGRLTKMATLDLRDNHFEGELPQELNNMTQMMSFNVENNMLSGQLLPFSTFGEQASQQDVSVYIDMSGNQLSGTVPADLFSALNDEAELILQLDGNDIGGTIPATLARFRNLVIGLEDNKITGIAPILCDPDFMVPIDDDEIDDSALSGCDKILCPPGTYSTTGPFDDGFFDDGFFAIKARCSLCPSLVNDYYGNTECPDDEDDRSPTTSSGQQLTIHVATTFATSLFVGIVHSSL